ncbi:MAG: DUF4062 domain-containing protein [Planctomycetes bacterium]|nr:DUF4062 domain-containing protein [Planctomycetota bacterium]
MARATRTFRIFVSSTFNDLKAERNKLQADVFPKLRALAERHGCRFQAIDLRWGVSEEAGLDHRAMRICLDELARCQTVSPRPNFIILLGDRYGWRPPPAEIPDAQFKALLPHIADRALLDEWYRRDENNVPPVWVLKSRAGEYVEYETWGPVERRLHETLAAAAKAAGFGPEALFKYTASATEQEIQAGALAVPDAREHVFAFFRTIEGLPEDRSAKDYVDLDENGRRDPDAKQRLEELKHLVEDKLRGNVEKYTVKWTGDGIATDHLDRFANDVERRLSEVIEAVVKETREEDPVKQEADAHKDFGEDRARVFIGRTAYLDRVEAHARGTDRLPLALWGESGSGKSALMAKAILRVKAARPEAVVCERFIGATAASSDVRSLLEGICKDLSRAYGDETPVPQDIRELVPEFPKRLALATAQKPLIVFLDALDQLSPADGAHSLTWLPKELPEHVWLVVATLPGEDLRALEGRLPESNRVKLSPMNPAEGRELLAWWLREAGRKLTSEQEADVFSKFDACGLPLYLKLAFEEARLWRSYDGLPCGADKVPGLFADIPGILEDLFARLSEPKNHGPLLVSRALGYLAAARSGLTEDELLDVLARDEEVMKPLETRWKLPERRLPVALWSRLYADLAPYLTQRAADGASVTAFYHRQVGEAAAREFLGEDEGRARHTGLAAYFGGQATWQDADAGKRPNRRKTSELPYQETRGERCKELEATLTDLDFIEAKCTAGGAYDLVLDYDRVGVGRARPGPPIRTARVHEGRAGVSCPYCLAWSGIEESDLGGLMPCPVCGSDLAVNPFVVKAKWQPAAGRGVEKREAPREVPLSHEVTDFSEFVRGQAHLLAREPGLTLQQAVNEPAATAAARKVRGRIDAGMETRPCFEWMNRPERRSACLITLAGHSSRVTACAYSPDGRRVVSASFDKTLKVWDAQTGQELATLAGHWNWVSACAYSPDGRRVVSASGDKRLKVWDAESGRGLTTFAGHSDRVIACAYSPDGRRVASGSQDKTLKLWDADTGRELATLAGHSDEVEACAYSPDGRRVVSGSRDKTLKVSDAETGRQVLTLAGHSDKVGACAYSPDGRRVVSGSHDKTLKVWDAETGREVATLAGHSRGVTACAYSPDGRRVVSASVDKTLKLWDGETGGELATLAGHSDTVDACAYASDGRRVLSASGDKTLKVWDAESGRELATLAGHSRYVTACAYSPDGRRVVSASWDNTLKVWDAELGREVATLAGHSDKVKACAYSPDGRRVVSASEDKTLKVWDAESGHELATLAGHDGAVYACAYSPDGRRVVSASSDKTLKLWDAESGRELTTLAGHSSGLSDCAYSPDGRRIVSASGDKTLKVWDAESGRELTTLAGHSDAVCCCAYAPDGRRVVSASWDKTLKVWDAESGRELATLAGHSDKVYACAYSPDGRRVVSASEDKTVRVSDAESGTELGRFYCNGAVKALAADRSGLRIVAGDWEGAVYILRLHGIEPGPPILTPVKRGGKFRIRCPFCARGLAVPEKALGLPAKTACCGKPILLAPTFCDADRPLEAP